MKQILQNLSNGKTSVVEVPVPENVDGHVLIASKFSLVSAGTERMLLEFGKANWLDKARQQPDKVKMVLNKLRTDGVIPTVEAVRSKLDQPIALGYCNAGVVIESRSSKFVPGDWLVSNGAHAEIVRVPENLCAKIPPGVDLDSAAFTVLAAIALQGIRLIKPTLGECVVVTGLGLVGLIAVQLLKAQGCRVLAIDCDSYKCDLARSFGAEAIDLFKGEDPIKMAAYFSRGRGVDAVLITASSDSNDIVSQAATMCRKRGRIVLVGMVGLELSRADFYEKELSFQVSCSYGPGRYDKAYEENGNDYPIAFVRWTEQRNFEAVLDMLASGTLKVQELISHRFSITHAKDAYALLDDKATLGILFKYPNNTEQAKLNSKSSVRLSNAPTLVPAVVTCAFVGAGNYASRILIPAFKDAGAAMHTLVSSVGVSSVHHGKKLGFQNASTSFDNALQQELVNTVVIATRHNQHADQVQAALKKGKHVFVEKPLAITLDELEAVNNAYQNTESKSILMLGFNRRFSPLVKRMSALLETSPEPKSFIFTMNAGAIPEDHWTQSEKLGGGRIIGEACHYIDLMRFLAGSKIRSHHVLGISSHRGRPSDCVSITIDFENGSFGTIHYFANGGNAFAKERIEVFCNNAVLQIDNFRKLKAFGWKGFKGLSLLRQDKGHKACAASFVNAISNGQSSPIAAEDIFEVSRVSIEIAQKLRGQA